MELFAFQQEDVDRLKSKRSRLVGNDPGTGKTYIGIALDQANRARDGALDKEGNESEHVTNYFDQHKVLKTLVVCPKAAIDVWDEHLMELTEDDIYVYDYHHRHQFMKDALDPKLGGYFIINYDSLRIKDCLPLSRLSWFHIIADEVHRIKNRKAQATIAFKKIPALYKTGMSGTPADNKPTDLWSILNWLWPNYYTSYWRFVRAYTYEEISDEGYSKVTGLNLEAIEHLKDEMRPWFSRRRKYDVLTDLPDKYYSRLWVELGPKQRKAYDEMKKVMIAWLEQHEGEIERGDPIIAQATVVQLIRLQQLSAGYLAPVIDPLTGEQLIKYRKKWNKDHTEFELIEVPQWKMVDPSAKLDALMELLKDRSDEQLIVFSQSKAAINLLGTRLEANHIPFGLYTGDVKQADRDQLVREFQNGSVRVFAGTIKAGGEAITLTASSTVVFLDRWWSPSKNIQAEDRAHRIGQKNAVEVIDIMARNTVDLGRWQTINLKQKWLMQLMGDDIDVEQLIKDIDLSKATELEPQED